LTRIKGEVRLVERDFHGGSTPRRLLSAEQTFRAKTPQSFSRKFPAMAYS
jgi:hypothetical protein